MAYLTTTLGLKNAMSTNPVKVCGLSARCKEQNTSAIWFSSTLYSTGSSNSRIKGTKKIFSTKLSRRNANIKNSSLEISYFTIMQRRFCIKQVQENYFENDKPLPPNIHLPPSTLLPPRQISKRALHQVTSSSFFKIKSPLFFYPLFFKEHLNYQVRVNKMMNGGIVNYHFSSSGLTSRIYPLIFL